MGCIIANNFNLLHTLECGQFFRYRQDGSSYLLNYRDIFFRVRQSSNKLFFDGVDKKFILNFFNLTTPFSRVLKSINKDKHINEAIKLYKGLRVIRQDPWECLISYLCSSAANIPKIKMNIELIAKSFGQNRGKYHTFPRPGHINNLKILESCKVGYRAKYILAVNGMVDDVWLNNLRELDYKSAKKKLTSLPGVGPKIADCVLLFSLGFTQAFPVDTWISKVMQELYFKKKKAVSSKKVLNFANEYFGEYAGIAQQYLYYWRRNQHDLAKKEASRSLAYS